MAFNPTPVQKDAINAKGNVLVSAAAGSGKTAVLTERVVSLIGDEKSGISADRILVVTFTKAAAAEMRSRIEARLNEECEKRPDDTHLMRQMLLFPSAKICTIDSFCIELVRENFDKLGINPDFKIVDDGIMSGLRSRAIEQVFEKQFAAQDVNFLKLLETVGSSYDDSVLADYVKRIHTFTTTLPNPHEWLKKAAYANNLRTNGNLWLDFSYEFALRKLKTAAEKIKSAIDILENFPEIYEKYKPAFADSRIKIDQLIMDVTQRNWNSLYYGVSSIEFLRLPSVRGSNDIAEIRTAKFLRERAKDICKKLSALFFDEWENILAASDALYPLTEKLSELVIDYDNTLNSLLKERNVLTFYNTEQMAFDLLCEYKNSQVKVRSDALEFINSFDEILVDEYQDTNVLQDMLFKVLSDNERKLFVVGDVKQSIYRFRGAEPSNFLEKKHRYLAFNTAKENQPKKIILGNNFRSRKDICEYINYFFSALMTAQTGAIDYGEEERLYPLAEYPSATSEPVEIAVLDTGENEDDDAVAEANCIAGKIKEIMSSGPVIRDEKAPETLRPARFSDFAVLLRSVKNKAGVYAQQLKKHGIPVSYSTGTFLQNREVSVVLSFLDILDNPSRDISLTSVMLSPLFYFTVDELAILRSNKRHGNLYSCVTAAAVNGDKHCIEFLKSIDVFRRRLMSMSVTRFLYCFYEETDFLNMMSALNNGEARKNNLLLLARFAQTYEENEGRSVGGFVRYMQGFDDESIVSDSSGNEDCVKIMTVHLSKGLQFPVCIFAACSSKFNKQDLRASLIIDRDLFFSYRFYDASVNRKFTTLQRQVLVERSNQLQLEEELRLAYVAMTRAQDKLILLLSVNNPQKKIESMAGSLLAFNGKVDASLFEEATSFADWILMTSLVHPDGKPLRDKSSVSVICQKDASSLNVGIYNSAEFAEIAGLEEQEVEKPTAICGDEKSKLKALIEENLSYTYPYEQLLSVASKSSVSKLANSAEDKCFAFAAEPSFACTGGASAAKRGTATHKIMQFIDFEKAKNNLCDELDRLVEWQFISENDALISNTKQIATFLQSELCRRICSSSMVKREMRFLTEMPATQIDLDLSEEFSDEMIVVQGAVDCLFEEDGSLVVVDFKTDRVKSGEQLADTYREQLAIYACACEKIFSKPVKEKIIYSFHLGESINV